MREFRAKATKKETADLCQRVARGDVAHRHRRSLHRTTHRRSDNRPAPKNNYDCTNEQTNTYLIWRVVDVIIQLKNFLFEPKRHSTIMLSCWVWSVYYICSRFNIEEVRKSSAVAHL